MQDALSRSVYLLIIWQEQVASSDRPAVWRCSLEDARTGERRSFATLEQMLAFLKEQTGDRDQRDTLD